MQLPAYLENSNLPDFTDRLEANLGTGTPPYVSIQGGRFTLIDSVGDTEPVVTVDPKTGVPYLDCVIIDAGDHPSKIYFGQAFDPGAQSYSPPKCWSDNGVAPSVNCSEPQAISCTADPTGVNGCKLAVWGSATSKVTGKGVPACGKYQKLALLIPGDDVEFLLRVPPNSLENLRAYNKKFKGHAFTARDVITRVSFEPDGIGTLTFSGLDFIDEATAKQRNEVLIAKKTDALVGRGDKPRVSAIAGQPVPAVGGQSTGGQAPLALSAPPAHIASSPVSVPVAEAAGPLAVQPATTPQATSATTTPAPASTGRRRGRPPKEAAPVAETAPVAPFRQPAEGGQAPNGQFGMAPAVAPNQQLEAAIKSVFG